MPDTLIIEITNPKAKELLIQLEELHWIKVLPKKLKQTAVLKSRKFRGILFKKQGKDIQGHLLKIRNEWDDT